jgi:Phage terminase large subunit
VVDIVSAPVKRAPRKSPPPDEGPVRLSTFQRRVMEVPEEVDLCLAGGRGGGKSWCLGLLALRHIEQYGPRARVLYLRQTHRGCLDFQAIALELFTLAYGKGLRFNGQENLFRTPSGGSLELNQIETEADFSKFQGRSISTLLVDECGEFPVPTLIDRLRSNLRAPVGVPLRTVLCANPGGPGHGWLSSRYIFRAAPWTPFVEEKSQRQFLLAPSTFADNEFIDTDAYLRQLEAATASDRELAKAWILGDWAIARGAFFASVLDESRNAVDPWPAIPEYYGEPWETFLAHDFGSSAPSVTYVVVKSPGAKGPDDRWYPRDSLILVDELATNEPDNLTRGLGWTVPILSEEILKMCKRWSVKPQGVADDAIFARTGHQSGSIADEFKRGKIYFRPAKKADRITGWNIMRRLLQNAGAIDQPGLYISRACSYFWATVAYLGRDPRRVEDLDSRGPDHAADAVRYGCLYQKREASVSELRI